MRVRTGLLLGVTYRASAGNRVVARTNCPPPPAVQSSRPRRGQIRFVSPAAGGTGPWAYVQCRHARNDAAPSPRLRYPHKIEIRQRISGAPGLHPPARRPSARHPRRRVIALRPEPSARRRARPRGSSPHTLFLSRDVRAPAFAFDCARTRREPVAGVRQGATRFTVFPTDTQVLSFAAPRAPVKPWTEPRRGTVDRRLLLLGARRVLRLQYIQGQQALGERRAPSRGWASQASERQVCTYFIRHREGVFRKVPGDGDGSAIVVFVYTDGRGGEETGR